jgi:periplasmic divalent cation tolerance protein
MAEPKSARVVLVTCGKLTEARRIARVTVEEKLAACVNIISAPVESLYRWRGKVESAREFLLIIKTSAPRLKRLAERIATLHSYDLPEFLVLTAGGSEPYLSWLHRNV